MKKNLTIGVTGSSGFIGRAFLLAVMKMPEWRIKVFDRNRYNFQNMVNLKEFVSGCNIILHMAAPGKNEDQKKGVRWQKNLLDAILKVNINCRIIFISSFAVYRIPKREEIINEDFELAPRNDYGRYKLDCERLLENAAKNRGIKSTVLRLANVYGPGKQREGLIISKIIKSIRSDGSFVVNGDGTQTRDFIYIDDVVDAIVASVKREQKENIVIYNICSSKPKSILEVINIVEDISAKKLYSAFNNNSDDDGGFWKGDFNKARKNLDWHPKTDFRKGLMLTLNHS